MIEAMGSTLPPEAPATEVGAEAEAGPAGRLPPCDAGPGEKRGAAGSEVGTEAAAAVESSPSALPLLTAGVRSSRPLAPPFPAAEGGTPTYRPLEP